MLRTMSNVRPKSPLAAEKLGQKEEKSSQIHHIIKKIFKDNFEIERSYLKILWIIEDCRPYPPLPKKPIAKPKGKVSSTDFSQEHSLALGGEHYCCGCHQHPVRILGQNQLRKLVQRLSLVIFSKERTLSFSPWRAVMCFPLPFADWRGCPSAFSEVSHGLLLKQKTHWKQNWSTGLIKAITQNRYKKEEKEASLKGFPKDRPWITWTLK